MAEKKEKVGPAEKKFPTWITVLLWVLLGVGLAVATYVRHSGEKIQSQPDKPVVQAICKAQMLRLNKKGEQVETDFTAEAGEEYEIYSRYKNILLIRKSGTTKYNANTTYVYGVSSRGRLRFEALEDGTPDIKAVRVK